METIEDLQKYLLQATRNDVWGHLLDRGTAWGIMRQAGVLPVDAPHFGETIDTDLAEYGFSVLRAALALRETEGQTEVTNQSFEKAAVAFESLVRNGSPEDPERGFYRVIAGAAYHLAGYSAIAYSLFSQHHFDANTTPAEDALILLILRDFSALREQTRDWLRKDVTGDNSIAQLLENNKIEMEEAVAIILNTTICRALAYFDFALQTGDDALLGTAMQLLEDGVKLSSDAGAVSLWWITRLCKNLIGDLWDHSLHVNLPISPPEGGEDSYAVLRQIFLTSLYARKNAEVELWPSQREAARRSSNLTDDLVVALPTSAGKTRVAEITALMTLSTNKRVLIVTPLRALSAQTERSFRKTFAPLGFSVSSLYGASGISSSDEDALSSKNIVIATPEKLDFALRSDPNLINDVGLIILDEGHMIGPTEREIRYEALVQRLLIRSDAAGRRIVCLSAILPDGEQLDDLTAWIRSDEEGEPVKSAWRPTRQRFGALLWQGTAAKLNFDLSPSGPFLAKFVEQIPPRGRQTRPFPRDAKDLSLIAAWKFASQGKRTLIFITQANWVEGYGVTALDLVKRGYLPTLLDDPTAITRALSIGREWLGDKHPAVEALTIGIAIHHGGLPNPFLREIELLLSEGVLKVTVASPTLSQGLNINATVLLVPYLVRSGKMINGEEFANVAGRAGRAFVDVEGLVVHVIYDELSKRQRDWRKLVESAKSRSLSSGLVQIVAEIMRRLSQNGVLSKDDAFEYLANSRDAWLPEEDTENPEEDDDNQDTLSHLVEKLDIAVFGLIEALDANSSNLPRLLDEALQGSLWARLLGRKTLEIQQGYRSILIARANLIWNSTTSATRKGHFAMGVGLEAGLALDAMSNELNTFIDKADDAAICGDEHELVEALIELARRLLVLRPFIPNKKNVLPANWEAILKLWIRGADVGTIGPENMPIVEDAFTYRLVWALEALRTRRVVLGWSSETIAGGGAASLETGVPQFRMSMLVRAGLPSRQAAISAIRKSNCQFLDGADMRQWLASEEITVISNSGEWPTPETASLWMRFRDDVLSEGVQKWGTQNSKRTLDFSDGTVRPPAGVYRIEIDEPHGDVWVCTPDYKRLVRLNRRVNDSNPSLFTARFVEGDNRVLLQRFGIGRAMWE